MLKQKSTMKLNIPLYFLSILVLHIISCSKSKAPNDNILLNNSKIKSIYITDNKLFYCEQNEDSTYRIVEYDRELTIDKINFVPDVMVKWKDNYAYGYNDHEGHAIVLRNGVKKTYEGEIFWKDNSNFLIKNYQYLSGKDYRLSFVSFPSMQEVEYYNYAIANPNHETKIIVINNDTTSILTPDLKLLMKTKDTFFTMYNGDYFELKFNKCSLNIDQIAIHFCYDNILQIIKFHGLFYIIYQYKNSVNLISEKGMLIDSMNIAKDKPISFFYHDSKLQIAIPNDTSRFLYTSKGRTHLVQQFYMNNGEFYSIELKDNDLFFFNESKPKKIKLGNMSGYEHSIILYDYIAIWIDDKVKIFDRDLNERGYFEGYETSYAQKDSNLFVLNSEGIIYKF